MWLAGVIVLIEATIFLVGTWQAQEDGAGATSLFENPLRVQVLERVGFEAYPVDGAVELADGIERLQGCLKDIREGYRTGTYDIWPDDEIGRCGRLAAMTSAIDRWGVLGQFDWHGVLPSAFVHANVAHMMVTLITLLAHGPVVARRFGPGRLVLFLLACGLAGHFLYWLIVGLGWAYVPWLVLRPPVLPVVGISGAIFGLIAVRIGMALHAARMRRELWRLGLTFKVWQPVLVLLLLHFGTVKLGYPIAWEVHLGGLLMGFALAPFMFRTPSEHRAYLRKVQRRLAR